MSALPLLSQHRSRQMEAGLLRARNDRRQRESIETKARKFCMADQVIKDLGEK